MKTILTVFKKELIDSLRDRRTLVAMVFVPLVLFPIMISISSSMLISHARKAQEKVLKVGVVTNGGAKAFVEMLSSRGDVKLFEGLLVAEGTALVRSDSLDAFVVFDAGFEEKVAGHGAGPVALYYKSAESSSIERRRVRDLLDTYEETLRRSRFESLSLDVSIVDAIDVSEQNLASTKERLAEEIGGFLPYLIIIFCFTGACIRRSTSPRERRNGARSRRFSLLPRGGWRSFSASSGSSFSPGSPRRSSPSSGCTSGSARAPRSRPRY